MEAPQTDIAETPGQKQARLRRERREAKIKAEGTSRLEKITKVSGRQNLPDAPPLQPRSPSSDDPEEIDLSTHPSTRSTPNSHGAQQPTEADIRALLRSGGPQPGVDKEPSPEEDPMMKMLSQLMGGMPGADGSGAGAGEDPLKLGMDAIMGEMGGGAKQSPRDYWWKIVHAVFAFVLGIYVTATSTAFAGPVMRIPGKVAVSGGETGNRVNLFWAFATAELILQSTRYFLERGKTDSGIGGWLGMISGFLGQPLRGYVRLVARYSGIWSTIMEDGCVLVFMVGVFSWWKGAVG